MRGKTRKQKEERTHKKKANRGEETQQIKQKDERKHKKRKQTEERKHTNKAKRGEEKLKANKKRRGKTQAEYRCVPRIASQEARNKLL